MPEKHSSFSWALVPAASPKVRWWFRILTAAVFLGILLVWTIDGLNTTRFHLEFVAKNITGSSILPRKTDAPPLPQFQNPNFTNLTIFSQPHFQTANLINPNFTLAKTIKIPVSSPDRDSSIPRIFPWISSDPFGANYSSNLLAQWLAPGGKPCKDSRTVDISIPGLDGKKRPELPAGEIHVFDFQALDDSGQPHCLGGDYFELDLSGKRWKSRPPVKDSGNGSYSFSLQVHPNFAGDYNLTVTLLFRHFEGLKFSPPRFAVDKVVRVVGIKFVRTLSRLRKLRYCKSSNFVNSVWSGRWTRHVRNDSCPISNDGRYRCQEPSFPCTRPWCDGSLGALESNGWVYSAHCAFKLYSSRDAWSCLSGRWIFWWGDSNHCDTIRNVLHFILDVHHIQTVPRIFDMNVTNPRDATQSVRITSIFNGHWNHTGNYQGLNSLADAGYRRMLEGYFSGGVVPDTMIMNSGLHDGVYWSNIRSFIKGADYAATFWAEVMDGVQGRGLRRPEIIYRTTVTTGGYARRLQFNPQKMEAFNGVVLEKLRQRGILDKVVDGFDMTFPWHYDNRCNDGVHYGRAPLKMKWRDGVIGHQYFVDLMLGHVLINALSPKP